MRSLDSAYVSLTTMTTAHTLDAEKLRRSAQEFQCTVIHIRAHVRASTQDPSGYLVLNPGDSWTMPAPSLIKLAFEGVLPGGQFPLIVLEVPAPSGASEASRDLLLRNAVAHQICVQAGAPAVLAIGPETREQYERTHIAIAKGLRQGLTLGELWSELRQLDLQHLHPPALFTQDPGQRLVGPRSS